LPWQIVNLLEKETCDVCAVGQTDHCCTSNTVTNHN